MKKTVIIALAALLSLSAYAQETPTKFKLYGFLRNYAVIDTREVNGGTHDLYYYMPKDQDLNSAGEDLNSGLNWKFVSLTTRLGLDFSGYQFDDLKISGKVEADFYSLNGSESANTIAQFRLRQAYMALDRDLDDGTKLLVNIGQTWHPMGADLPHGICLESGAPFGPFNRSPQVMAHWTRGKWTYTGGLLYLSQYLPMDAETAKKSVAPFKYGFPEIYAGIAYKSGPFVAKFGLDNTLTRPVRKEVNVNIADAAEYARVKSLMEAVSVFAYLQYTKDLFQLKTKVTLAQAGEHLNILSGYGIASENAPKHTIEYTPMEDLTSFVSFQYGKKVQFLGMIGYMKQLGTTKDLKPTGISGTTPCIVNKTHLQDGNLWLNTAAATNIQQAFRLTPTVLWNMGKLQIGLEYDYTMAEFGNSDATRNARGLYEAGNTHWIGNHRLLWMTKFNF
ncbi:MAG: hypothetical protein J6W94_05935 [Bacteroidales bacterium]|nr:hypothetical protein [Bacteroidales bacterium]MBP5676534.1 hypothetical protein [Bacteroidales bacterium]